MKSARTIRNTKGPYVPYTNFPLNYGPRPLLHPSVAFPFSVRQPTYHGSYGTPLRPSSYLHESQGGSYSGFRPIVPMYNNPSRPAESDYIFRPENDYRPPPSVGIFPSNKDPVVYSQPDPSIQPYPSGSIAHRPPIYFPSERDPAVHHQPNPPAHETDRDFPTLYYPPKPNNVPNYFSQKPKPGFVFPND